MKNKTDSLIELCELAETDPTKFEAVIDEINNILFEAKLIKELAEAEDWRKKHES